MIINKDLKYILIESIYFRTLENLKLNFILVKITSGFHVKKIKSFRSNSGLLKMNWSIIESKVFPSNMHYSNMKIKWKC